MGKLIPRRGILIGPGQQSRRRQVCDSPDGCTTVYSHRCDLVLQASIGNQRRSQKGLCVKEADMSSVSRLTCRNHPLHASVTSLREARNRSRGDPRRQYQLEMLRTQVAHVVLGLIFRMWQYFCKGSQTAQLDRWATKKGPQNMHGATAPHATEFWRALQIETCSTFGRNPPMTTEAGDINRQAP
jgi:hypothetical protein